MIDIDGSVMCIDGWIIVETPLRWILVLINLHVGSRVQDKGMEQTELQGKSPFANIGPDFTPPTMGPLDVALSEMLGLTAGNSSEKHCQWQ